MRTLILGAKGPLGRDLVEVFRREGEVRGLDLPEVDIADEIALQPHIAGFAPDLVLNAAQYNDPERAEKNMEAAFRVNESGARNVAEIAAYLDIPLMYFSSEYVFADAARRPLKPEDPIAPLGVYGASKAAGERATRKATPKHFIVRSSWLYGPHGDNFVKKLLRAAQVRPSLPVVQDEVGSPTHTWDLAEAACALAQTNAYGDYHAANLGACSRFEFAQAVLELAGSSSTVVACPATELPPAAHRPPYSVLDSTKLQEVTGYVFSDWRQALARYFARQCE